MATTAIWAVKGWLGKVVIYIENPDKTENPSFYEKQDMTEHQVQGLVDVIDYATQSKKTENTLQQFVTGVNCQPGIARDEMMAVKKKYGKDDGIVAFHGYQSFAPGEVTPELAHKIGTGMAEQLWGERFQVVVATHLDKANHIHNHFVINSVSLKDGYRYNDCTATYMEMRKASDTLCREYGLSVIEEPQRGKSKHYGEWNAEKQGHSTWRGLVKSDVDAAIRGAMTERQFWDNLRRLGYEVKQGKDISVRPPGKERFVRLKRNFGDDYTIESIRRRILEQTRPQRQTIPQSPPPKRHQYKGSFKAARKVTGLRALYFYYLYKLGALPKKREPNPKRVYFLLREDIRYMQNISREARLLAKHGIDTDVQLVAHKDGVQGQINTLYARRKRLRNQVRSITDEEKSAAMKSEIAALSGQIGLLRREVRLCEDIEKRSAEMPEKLQKALDAEKSETKELKKDEPFRRRR
jgi:hypothetical protein